MGMNSKQVLSTNCILTTLPPIHHPDGNILHALKSTDKDCFLQFGEAYFSSIMPGCVKGWKQHQSMTMNIVVPVGSIQFSIYDNSRTNHDLVVLGFDRYARLTIPPLSWVAFKCNSKDQALLLNIASLPHDPNEAINQPLDFLEFSQK